ncbi:RICIN domain-containing protein [Actinosynnema sp. NPDC053489]|uniref:NHL domain-containing protein n=1 Tax=Actinosynnema sp. NPDC053489 TaxID=3363916 RepID=UPI0037C5697F
MSTAVVTTTPTITTVAGTGVTGYGGDGGPATAALLSRPLQVALDGTGNLYVVELGNNRVRKVAPDGTITTVAGTGAGGFSGDGGPATSAQLWAPRGVAVDGAGNLYVADAANSRVRKVAPDGTITTVAGNGTRGFTGDGGPATAAQLSFPCWLALDGAGNLHVADSGNGRVRRVSPDGRITTVAGDGTRGFGGDGGPATSARLSSAHALAVDGAGNLYLADAGNDRVRRVSPDGRITTVAGDGTHGFAGDGGPATSARLARPHGLAVDRAGDLYIADTANDRVRKVAADGTITTVAHVPGSGGGPGSVHNDLVSFTVGLAVDPAGTLYLADYRNPRVRAISAAPRVPTPASGTVVTWTNVRSRLRIGVHRESTKDGAEVHQLLAAARDHQRWRLTAVDRDNGDDVYVVENLRSGKVLEVAGALTNPGAIVVQGTYSGPGARHQQWRLVPADATGQVFRIANRHSGLSLGAVGNAQGVLKQDDADRDQWLMTPV